MCLREDADGVGLSPARSHTLLSVSPRHAFLSKYRNVKKVIQDKKENYIHIGSYAQLELHHSTCKFLRTEQRGDVISPGHMGGRLLFTETLS